MITATLYVTDGHGAYLSLDAADVPTYPVTHDDGRGPVPAATAVLHRHGWRPAGAWVHDSGGVSGDVWTVPVERDTAETR